MDMEPFQPSLFVPQVRRPVEAPPYVAHNEESRVAAQSVAPVAGTLRARVLDIIAATPEGLTDEEGCARTGMNPSTWRPRRVELLEAGHIVRTGVRPGKSGRLMAIWSRAAGEHLGSP
jgi:hypothetical protein